MNVIPEPKVLDAQRMDGGVLIRFADGRAAIFPAKLLYAVLDQAKEVQGTEDD